MAESRSRKRKRKRYTPPATKQVKKATPPWMVAFMVTLLVVGLLWIVLTYVFQGAYPIPGIGNANLLIGTIFLLAGLGLMTTWH